MNEQPIVITNPNIRDLQNICKHCLKCMLWLIKNLRHYPIVVEHRFYGGNLPIHKAIEYKCQTSIIQQLLHAWPESVNKRNDSGMLPLHVACEFHHKFNVIEVILAINRNNAKVTYNATQCGRYPPLHLDVIWLLISRSLDTISARTSFGQNVLHIALNVKKLLSNWLIYCLIQFTRSYCNKRQTMDDTVAFCMFASEW